MEKKQDCCPYVCDALVMLPNLVCDYLESKNLGIIVNRAFSFMVSGAWP